MLMINPIITGKKAKYIHERLADPKLFDPKSFRVVAVRPDRKIIIGCPKGYWDDRRKRCLIGTRAQAILRLKPEYVRMQNPKDLPVLIGKQVVAVEYYDPEKAIREGLKEPHRIWRHDFKTKDAMIFGLPDGSVLIKSASGKRLWEWR
jgi:hypothetical protein